MVVAAFDRCALLSIWKAEVHVEPSDVIESISLSNPNYPMSCHIRSHKNIISGHKQLVSKYFLDSGYSLDHHENAMLGLQS